MRQGEIPPPGGFRPSSLALGVLGSFHHIDHFDIEDQILPGQRMIGVEGNALLAHFDHRHPELLVVVAGQHQLLADFRIEVGGELGARGMVTTLSSS